MRLSLLSSVLLAVTGAYASVHMPLLSAAAVPAAFETAAKSVPPSQDPFYSAPEGFEKKPVGTILKHRKVPKALRVGPALETDNYKSAYQLLFRTTNGLGKASVAVQTVIVPKKGDPSKLLSYQTFYDAAFIDCSPSYTLQTGQNNLNVEGVFISTALRQGWYVTVGDYEGLDAAFTVGKQAGHATLDGIRATLKTKRFTNIAKSPKVALYGYSGGALASEWAMELQPSYAKKMKIVGAAFGGLTPNVTSVIESVNASPNSNLIPTGTLGFANQYKNVTKFLNQALKPSMEKAFKLPQRSCDTGALTNKNIFSYFKEGKAVLNDPILASTVQSNGIMGLTNTPKVPLYIYKSAGDEVSPIADTDSLVSKYCEDGASIHYVRNTFGTHETEAIIGLPDALMWLKKRLNGNPPPKPCSTKTSKITKLEPSAKNILGNTVFQELKAQLASFKSGN